MTAKYNMTPEENLAYANRMLADIIWKQANIEGINVTFPDTETIIQNGVVSGLQPSEIVAIVNLKHAWYKLFDSITEPLTLDYVKAIHAEVAHNLALASGVLRSGDVGIAGCVSYKPPLPNEQSAKETLAQINGINDPERRALELFAWLTKSQLFWDGNKRTALLVANKVLIQNGRGILNIPQKGLGKFNKLLHNYYEHDDKDSLLDYLSNKAIDGISLRNADSESVGNPRR